MPKVLKPDEAYSGRRMDVVVVNTSLDEEAVAILHQFCPPGRKATGRFLGRLLYEHAARVAERQRLQRVVQAAVQESTEI